MAKKVTLTELADMLSHVVKHMATKDDVAQLTNNLLRVQQQVSSIEQELKLGKYEARIGKLEDAVFPARTIR